MNSFLFSAITICVAAQCALAQYQQHQMQQPHQMQAAGYGYQQRKMAPMPQTYQHREQAGYRREERPSYMRDERPQYEQAPMYEASGYGAKQESSYAGQREERAPSASYGKQQQQQQQQYQSSSYKQQAAPAYAKPAPKYEEPYHPPMPFAWGYDINDGYGGAQYHKESGDEYGKRTGSYGYTDAYGIYRQVDYVADENGFRATIKTNEPGTSNESPADVHMQAYEPPSNYYAGSSGYSSGSSAGYGQPAKSAAYQQPSTSSSSSYQKAPRHESHSSYKRHEQRSSYAAQAPRYEHHQQQQQQQQYSSSVIVPVYQKPAAPQATVAAVAAPTAAAKRH